MPRTIAIYARVSSKDQSLASQLPELQRWADAQEGTVEWFQDSFTGKTMKRPGMEKLLAAIQVGEIERVVCWRLDRPRCQ